MKTLTSQYRLGVAILLLLFSAATCTLARAQQTEVPPEHAPRVENARMETRSVSGSLVATIAEAEKNAANPAWMGYGVKAVAGQRSICCGNYSDSRADGCGKCALETERVHGNNTSTDKSASKGAVKLEGGEQLIVLFRLQDKHLTRIKLASEDCVLDAGGLPFVWLTDVKPAESGGACRIRAKRKCGRTRRTFDRQRSADGDCSA
jgi:hypothetical protein